MKNKIQDFMKKVSKAQVIDGKNLRSLKGGGDPPPLGSNGDVYGNNG